MLTISLFQFIKRFKPAEFQNKVHQVGVSLRVKIYKLNRLVISMEMMFYICVQIRSFFWSVFSPNIGKYRPEKTAYLNTFHAVMLSLY